MTKIALLPFAFLNHKTNGQLKETQNFTSMGKSKYKHIYDQQAH